MFGYIYKFFLYLIKEELKDIKHVDLFNNQYDNLGDNDAIPYPSVLVKIIPQNEFKQHSSRLQSIIVNVELYLATEFATNLRGNSKNVDKAIEHLSLVDRLFITFDGLNNNSLPDEIKSKLYEIGNIRRLNVELLEGYNNIKVTKTTFTFNFADASAFDKLETLELQGIDVSVEFK